MKLCPGNQGRGWWTSTRKVAQPTARRPSPSVRSGVSAVAEIRTGARNSMAKGFSQPAGQVEQRRQLQDVEGEERGGGVVAQPMACRILDAQEQVDPDRDCDHQEAEGEGQREAEAEPDRRPRPPPGRRWRASAGGRACRGAGAGRDASGSSGRSWTSSNRIGPAHRSPSIRCQPIFLDPRAVRCRFVNGATLAAENRACFSARSADSACRMP